MPILKDEKDIVILDSAQVQDPLVERFPNFAAEIENARRQSVTDRDIGQALDRKSQDAFQSGQSLDAISSAIGAPPTRLLNTLPNSQLRDSRVGLEHILAGIDNPKFQFDGAGSEDIERAEKGLQIPGEGEALKQPFVDPVFAGAGGFATGGLGGAALSILTEPFIGQVTENVTEAHGPLAGIVTSLLTGVGVGILEQKVLRSITGVASKSRLSKLFGFTDDAVTKAGADVDLPTELSVRKSLGEGFGGVGGVPPTVGRGVSRPPISSSPPPEKLIITPDTIISARKSRRVVEEFSKERGGRPVTVDHLPQLDDDTSARILRRVLKDKRKLSPVEIEDVLKSMNPLEVKNALAKIAKEGVPKKAVGRPSVPGGASQSPDRASVIPSEILETIAAKSTSELSELTQGIVSRTKQLTEGTRNKVVTQGENINLSREMKPAKATSLSSVLNDLQNAADARGATLEADIEAGTYTLNVDGETVKLTTLTDVSDEIARRGINPPDPVSRIPLAEGGDKRSTFAKVINEESLTKSDRRNLAKQKQSLRQGAVKSVEDLDPRLEGLKDLGFSSKDIAAFESGKLTPQAEKLMAQKFLEAVSEDDVTFGFGAGQIAPRLGLKLNQLKAKMGKLKLKRAKGKSSIKRRRLIEQGLSVKETRDFSLLLSYAKEVGKDTPKGIASIMRSIGGDADVAEYITTNLLNTQSASFTVPVVPGLLVDNPKINTLQTFINTQEAAFDNERRAIEQFAQGFAKNEKLDQHVVQLMRGERSMQNASAEEKQALLRWKALAKDFADRTGIQSDATYLTRLTDFEVIYDSFKNILGDVEYSSLNPKFKEQIPTVEDLDNIKRIFFSNKTWDTVPPADRAVLKKAFKFKGVKAWEELPQKVKDGLPEEIFSPYLLERSEKKFPTVGKMSEIIRAYATSMARKIHLDPVLVMGEKLMSTIRKPVKVAPQDGLTDRAFMQRQLARVVGRPEADDKAISRFIQTVNGSVGMQLLSEAGFEAGTRAIQGGFLRGAIGPDSAIANITLQPINVFMSSGRLGSALLKTFKGENKRDLAKIRQLFGGTLDMIRRESGPVKRGTPLTRAVTKYDEAMSKVFLSPLSASEHLVRGITLQAEIEAGIAKGLDPVENFALSAGKASSVLPNLEMDDVLATAALQQVPRQTFVNPTRSGRAPIFTGKAGRLTMTLTSFVIGQQAAFKQGLMRSIESGDNGRAARYLIALGALLTIPTLMDEMGFDVRNYFSAKNLHVRVTAPFFRSILNGVEAVSGRTISSRKRAEEQYMRFIKTTIIPQKRFGSKVIKAFEDGTRGYAVDKHMGRLYDTEPWRELFNVAGIPLSKAYKERDARFKIGQVASEFAFDKNEALEALLNGDEATLKKFSLKWKTEIDETKRLGKPIFTQDMLRRKLGSVSQRALRNVPKPLRVNPEVQEQAEILRGEEPSLLDSLKDFFTPGDAGAAELEGRIPPSQLSSAIKRHGVETPAQSLVPDKILLRQIMQESKGDPKAKSPTGPEGLAQFEKKTWDEWLGRLKLPADTPRTDPSASIILQRAYMDWLMRRPGVNGHVDRALAAYNAGLSIVQKAVKDFGPVEWVNHMGISDGRRREIRAKGVKRGLSDKAILKNIREADESKLREGKEYVDIIFNGKK